MARLAKSEIYRKRVAIFGILLRENLTRESKMFLYGELLHLYRK